MRNTTMGDAVAGGHALDGFNKDVRAVSLIGYRLEIFGTDFHGSMLINEIDGQDEPEIVIPADQDTLQAAHSAVANSDSLADGQFVIGLHLSCTEIGAQKLDGLLRNRNGLTVGAYNAQHAGRSENFPPLSPADAHKQVRREQGKNEIDALTVLPGANRAVRWEKRFDVSMAQVPDGGFLILGHREHGIPPSIRRIHASVMLSKRGVHLNGFTHGFAQLT